MEALDAESIEKRSEAVRRLIQAGPGALAELADVARRRPHLATVLQDVIDEIEWREAGGLAVCCSAEGRTRVEVLRPRGRQRTLLYECADGARVLQVMRAGPDQIALIEGWAMPGAKGINAGDVPLLSRKGSVLRRHSGVPVFEDAAVSPDGSWLAFGERESTGYATVVLIDLATGRRVFVELPLASATDVAWAPDSKRLAFVGVEDESARRDLWVLSLTEQSARRLVRGVFASPAWREGALWALRQTALGEVEVCRIDVDCGDVEPLENQAPGVTWWAGLALIRGRVAYAVVSQRKSWIVSLDGSGRVDELEGEAIGWSRMDLFAFLQGRNSLVVMGQDGLEAAGVAWPNPVWVGPD